MTDKHIIGGRGSAKSFTTLNTVEVMLGNERLEEALKAKEQECEELKGKVLYYEELFKRNVKGFDTGYVAETFDSILQSLGRNLIREENIKLQSQLDQLKAENERLDTENKRLVAEIANPVFDSFEELDKLKATLTEIKEIAEDYPLTVHAHELAFEQILQKISECEGNDELTK